MSQVSEIIEKLGAGFESFKADHSHQVRDLESRIEDLEKRAARPKALTGGDGAGSNEERAAFREFLKTGNPEAHARALGPTGTKSLNATTGSGQYAVPEYLERDIRRQLVDAQPLRGLVRVVTADTGDYKIAVSESDTGAAWAGETDTRNETSAPTLREIAPTQGEAYAIIKVSNHFLHDAVNNVEEFLRQEVVDQFAVSEAAAIISGNGTSKPTGFLNTAPEAADDDDSPPRTWPALRYTATGAADSFGNSRIDSPPGDPADTLIDCMYSLRPAYRQGAVWLMNSTTFSIIRKFKDADGNYLWRAGMTQGDGETLIGYPVKLCEQMPDIGTNAIPVAFGNFRRMYTLVDIGNIGIIIDPYTTKGYTLLYFARRVAGAVTDPDAVRVIKCSSS